MKKTIRTKKLELILSIILSIAILIISYTEVGYVSLSQHRTIDLSIILALFASLIGGYKISIPVSIIWGCIYFSSSNANLELLSIYSVIGTRFIFVVGAIESYKYFRKRHKKSPMNVYRATIVAILSKNIFTTLMMIWKCSVNRNFININRILVESGYQIILELSLGILSMSLIIRHLREIHILNGVKRREKNKRQGVNKA